MKPNSPDASAGGERRQLSIAHRVSDVLVPHPCHCRSVHIGSENERTLELVSSVGDSNIVALPTPNVARLKRPG
jgi:hypothetical protein